MFDVYYGIRWNASYMYKIEKLTRAWLSALFLLVGLQLRGVKAPDAHLALPWNALEDTGCYHWISKGATACIELCGEHLYTYKFEFWHILNIISAKEVMFYMAFVYLCLAVCLLATSLKMYTDEILLKISS